MIGDGMGLSQMYSGLTANKGSLNIERCPFIGLSKTQSADDYVTDSVAGGMTLNEGEMSAGNLTAVYTTKGHTVIPVPVYAFGAGTQNFAGIYQNTEIFNKCMNLLGFGKTD